MIAMVQSQTKQLNASLPKLYQNMFLFSELFHLGPFQLNSILGDGGFHIRVLRATVGAQLTQA